jgi:hypothetical protein
MKLTRRRWVQCVLAASALPFARDARGGPRGQAQRLIVFYFPDGVAGRSQDGQEGLWDARMAGGEVVLSELLEPLGDLKRECLFLRGLSLGPTDEGSHPGGAKKLLTGVDGGQGESIDQFLARTVGAGSAFRELYLGAMAGQNNASGDKYLSYPRAGTTVAPEDDPLRAFRRLFPGGPTPTPEVPAEDPNAESRRAVETALMDLTELGATLGAADRSRLEVHTDALREVSRRMTLGMPSGTPSGDGCASPRLALEPVPEGRRYDPERFPEVLRAQTDVLVQAMACGLTRVGVLQASQHTSELIMSRFRGTDFYDPGFDLRSHQASHYGPRQDRTNRLFTDFVKQRRWWVAQFRYLLEQLRARPERGGTMLDHSVVWLCSEVSDGNTHSHREMPFVLAGRAGGRITPGRVLSFPGRRHGDLLATLARALGSDVERWGDGAAGLLPGVLT